jgi:hypothetical protein
VRLFAPPGQVGCRAKIRTISNYFEPAHFSRLLLTIWGKQCLIQII